MDEHPIRPTTVAPEDDADRGGDRRRHRTPGLRDRPCTLPGMIAVFVVVVEAGERAVADRRPGWSGRRASSVEARTTAPLAWRTLRAGGPAGCRHRGSWVPSSGIGPTGPAIRSCTGTSWWPTRPAGWTAAGRRWTAPPRIAPSEWQPNPSRSRPRRCRGRRRDHRHHVMRLTGRATDVGTRRRLAAQHARRSCQGGPHRR